MPGKCSHWSIRGVPGGLTAVVVCLLSPLTVVTAESASKQLRAVKSLWNVRRPPGSQVSRPVRFLSPKICLPSDKLPLRMMTCKLNIIHWKNYFEIFFFLPFFSHFSQFQSSLDKEPIARKASRQVNFCIFFKYQLFLIKSDF